MVKDFEIPVDKKVLEFKHHLDCYPRTILSAKFGDGKSYFLNKFCRDENVLNDYEFITVYPVNYQVLDNVDVFDILKRDIILQMGIKDMVSESDGCISEDAALLYCIKNKGLTILESLLDVGANASGVSVVGSFCKSAAGLINIFREAKKTYDDISTDIDKLIDKVSTLPIDEDDLYSRIIKRNLEEWREANRKKVGLIIEDMDRLDPAHIFRILNVLSAQLDSCYYSGNEVDVYKKNKLGFDNIVLVLHYDNLENIYKHVYGADADFEGYVSKFITGDRFVYSLEKERVRYFYDVIVKRIGISRDLVEKLIPEADLKELSLRKVAKALESPEVQLDASIEGCRVMRMFVVMFRLLESPTSVVNNISDAFGSDYSSVIYDMVPAFVKSEMVYQNVMIISKGNRLSIYKFNEGKFLHYTEEEHNGGQGTLTPIVVARKLVELIYK